MLRNFGNSTTDTNIVPLETVFRVRFIFYYDFTWKKKKNVRMARDYSYIDSIV